MIARPQVVAFDVIETLFSLDAVNARFEDAGLSSPALDLWLARSAGRLRLCCVESLRALPGRASSGLSQSGSSEMSQQADVLRSAVPVNWRP